MPKAIFYLLKGDYKLSGLRSHRRGQAGRDEVKRTTRGEAPRAFRDEGLGLLGLFGLLGLLGLLGLGFRV